MTFGEKLRYLRQQNGWSMTDFIKRLDDEDGIKVSRGRLSMWENDKNDPNFRVVQRIAHLFGISVDYFSDRATSLDQYRLSNDDYGLKYKFNQLVPRRKKAVIDFINLQLDEQEK